MILIVCGLLFGWQVSMAQQTMKKWTLQDCLDYALENNIQLRQSRNDYLSGLEETKEAKAARLPSLSASVTQGFTNYPSRNAAERNSYTGNYGVNAGLTLYEGGRLRLGVQKSKMQNDIDRLLLDEAANDIRIVVVQAYMQALYAEEAVEIAQNTADVSKAELDRARVMHEVGTISRVDLAQLESQWASDSYQVAVSEATLSDCKLQLKQLLELDVMEEIELADVSFGQERILSLLVKGWYYRSYFLHFECGVWMYRSKAILECRDDFLKTLDKCHEITYQEYMKTNVLVRIIRSILNLFSPLL